MNVVNEINESVSATGESTPEKLVIHDRTDTKIFFERLLKAIQTVIKVFFLIGFGAIAIGMERLRNLKKKGSDAGPSADFSDNMRPQGIKVPVLPIDNYSLLDPDRIVEGLVGLSTEQLKTVRDFEGTHQNRNRILEAIGQHLQTSH